MKKTILLFFAATILVSCKKTESEPIGNNFYFENPQPINDSELKSIPRKFQGIFVNSDSIFLNINDHLIFTEKQVRFRCHKNQMDSLKNYFEVVDGNYISKENKEIYSHKLVGDSIEFSNKEKDTIFLFSDSQKAKLINGLLTLSVKDSIYWKIRFLKLNNNELKIKYLYSDEDLKSMDSITKNHSKKIDSLSYIISPSRKEFKKISGIKNIGFDSKYIKVKK